MFSVSLYISLQHHYFLVVSNAVSALSSCEKLGHLFNILFHFHICKMSLINAKVLQWNLLMSRCFLHNLYNTGKQTHLRIFLIFLYPKDADLLLILSQGIEPNAYPYFCNDVSFPQNVLMV